jgi:co-chaperonin GroES (HSP10)
MRRLFVFVAVVIFALAFVGTLSAQEKKGQSASAGQKPSVYKEEVVTETLTVEAIDLEKRIVTLRRADGSIFDLNVGEEVRNLPQVKVGDEVITKYYESLFVQVTKPGGAEGSQVKGTAARAKPGEKPAAMGARQVTVTATVEKIGKETMIATLKGPDGEVVDVKVRDPKNLENVNVGDQVVFTYTEGMAVSVEKPQKK